MLIVWVVVSPATVEVSVSVAVNPTVASTGLATSTVATNTSGMAAANHLNQWPQLFNLNILFSPFVIVPEQTQISLDTNNKW
jgi:hypothetical protein